METLPRLLRALQSTHLLATALFAGVTSGSAVYLSYEEAQPVLEAMREILPPKLEKSGAENWHSWLTGRDSEIRARVAQGSEDSLVNLLLFGTSFTTRPRIPLAALLEPDPATALSAESATGKALRARIEDLLVATAGVPQNERLLVAKRLLQSKGVSTPSAASQYLLDQTAHVLSEQERFRARLVAIRNLPDATDQFIERSTLFSSRGLATDTSLLPDFAVEQALRVMKSRGLMSRVTRVAIIGPGLDFVDKTDGYDFYPLQTLQPFALIDSLLRLGLAQQDNLTLTAIDLNPIVVGHIARARRRAEQGTGYALQVPLNSSVNWNPELTAYWRAFGDQIGQPSRPLPVPQALAGIQSRSVKVRPAFAASLIPVEMNIVLQHLALPPAERFDLILGTNVFLYYDVFEQALAMKNIEAMLKPGGFLLTNTSLLQLPSSQLVSLDYQTVVYSDRQDDGDHMIWFGRTGR